LTIWLLQYGREPATPTMPGSNVLRVAVQQAAGGPWVWWDLRPFQVNPAWANEWFDFNHAALSGSSLYVGSNVFSVFGNPNPWTRSVVFRIGLDGLAATPPSLTFSYFQSTDASMICTQGATDTMYMADLVGTSTLRVYTWSEVTNLVTQTDVTVAPTVFSQVGLFGNTNDGRNWLQRCDNRLTGAWVAQGILGFMWASDRMTGRPFAFTRVVRINAVSKAVIDQPDIWHNSVAYAYANASTNNAGDVGISLWRGGGLQHPGHVIGVWDNFNNVWSLMATRDSTHSPNDNKWGDYTTVRRHSPDAATWIAAAHTLQGGDGPTAVEPRFVHFRKKVV
jgi:hypothetical protein